MSLREVFFFSAAFCSTKFRLAKKFHIETESEKLVVSGETLLAPFHVQSVEVFLISAS